jgi:hypothetical protein
MLYAEEVVVPQIRAVQSKVAQDVLTQMRSERVVGTKEEIMNEHNKRTTAAVGPHFHCSTFMLRPKR